MVEESAKQAIDITCPKCQHNNRTDVRALGRTSPMWCEKCGEKIEITVGKPQREEYKPVVRVTTVAGDHLDIEITVREDGIWHFGGENEAEVAKALELDSDRAVGVIAGSMVEARIREAILFRCKHVPDIEKRQFHPSGAMGSFSVQIDLASMMGLISDRAYRDLILMKDIRNLFAHRLDRRDFNSPKVLGKAKALKLIETHVTEFLPGPGQHVVSLGPNAIPKISVPRYPQRKTNPRERYLITAQLFMAAFATAKLPNFAIPFI